jgi:hypothetical protein
MNRSVFTVAFVWFFTVICIVASSNCFAWNEPDSFMGIKFFRDIRESIKQCKGDWLKWNSKTGPCFTPQRDGTYEIENLGFFFNANKVRAYTVSQKFAMLDVDFPEESYPTAVAVFQERYGKPTKVLTESWISQAGLSVPSQILRWEGKRISIAMRQRNSQIDRSQILYDTDLWREYAAKRNDELIKKRAKGL